ncbi:hypothetical protein ACI3ET_13385 [Ornithinimicrobium sp. LYQ121]|uniref:hypothetical protein n=1 Tax=Ornithinimicrobium sp. LYQ121 TaxID=3378801 RepID=UPI00385509E7
MTPTRHAVLVAALVLPLGACGNVERPADATATTPAATSPATSDPAATTEPAPPEDDMQTSRPGAIPVPGGDSALPTGPVPASVVQRPEVQAAIADLAQRRSVEVEDVTVAGWAEVTWSDGSLGCPQPGMMYTQALVPGEQLVLGIDDELFSYHAATGKPFSYCASPMPPSQSGPATS